jgi:ferrous iron transport protein B
MASREECIHEMKTGVAEKKKRAALQHAKKVVLVGHPNVGKSAVFSHLTGHLVTISNYPGTTVDIFRGFIEIEGQQYEVIDTPGVNSLFAQSEDERVTLEVLQREKPDLIIQVADGKNIRRALLLTDQLAKLEIPLILNLNMKDERDERGIKIDSVALCKRLGIPVIDSVATRGDGISDLRDSLGSTRLAYPCGRKPIEWVDEVLGEVHSTGYVASRWSSHRTQAFLLASAFGSILHLSNYFAAAFGWRSLESVITAWGSGIGLSDSMVTLLSVTGAYLLPVLLPVLWAMKMDPVFRERFGVWSRRLRTGIPIMAVTLSLVYQLVGNIGAQVLVEILEGSLFGGYLNPFLAGLIPAGFFHDLLMGKYGIISVGLTYGLAIVLPVVSTFFVAFSFLEDSGYLPRLSVLSDRLFRPMGLNGKAFLPMVLGLGCVTMATMTTRILSSKRERIIATFLLALGVPCSAQLGVLMGITAGVSGWAVLFVFGTVVLQLFLTGIVLSRMMPGTSSAFILSVPPIRFPILRNILTKTFLRVKWFLKEALPLFVLGSFLLFALDKLSLLEAMIDAVEPIIVGLLNLPREVATIFLLGFLRRDYGAAGLYEMSRQGQLDSIQIVVSLTVMVLFVPCIANLFVMIKERGLAVASLIFIFITVYAVLVGSVVNQVLSALGITF